MKSDIDLMCHCMTVIIPTEYSESLQKKEVQEEGVFRQLSKSQGPTDVLIEPTPIF